MKEKIIEIRKLIPIPLGEATQLLKEHNGDVQISIQAFKDRSIARICELTNCEQAMAVEYYTEEKFDFNRTVSSIREAMYDKCYKQIEGLTKEGLRSVMQWISIIEQKDFATSLDYTAIKEVEKTLALIPILSNIAILVEKARKAKETIFTGYTDTLPLEDFVRRHKLLDDDSDFQAADRPIPLKLTVMREELMRHIRNL